MPSTKSLKVSFVTSKTQKNRGFSISTQYTSKEFDKKTCYLYIILGFWKTQNFNSGGHKTSIFNRPSVAGAVL